MFNSNQGVNATTVSLEEKIDYIYRELKFQKRTKVIKFLLKLTLVGIFLYFIYTLVNSANKEMLIEEYTQKFGELVTPIITNITKEMLNNMQEGTQNIDEAKIKQILLKELNK